MPDKPEGLHNFSLPNPNCINCKGNGEALENTGAACIYCWNYWYNTEREQLDRNDLVMMATDMRFAFMLRLSCPECYGYGITAESLLLSPEPDPCQCVLIGTMVLDRWEKRAPLLIDEYLWLSGLDPDDDDKELSQQVEKMLKRFLDLDLKDTVDEEEE